MKATFRQSMAWVHTWTGLLLGWVLFFIFLTGTAGYFDTEIDRWMQPEQSLSAPPVSTAHAIGVGLHRLQTHAPHAERWFVAPPNDRNNPNLRIYWEEPPGRNGHRRVERREVIDLATGEPVSFRATGGGQLLYRMHYELHYLPSIAAHWIVGVAAMFMLVAITAGVIVHRKLFADFFTFRPCKGRRSWLDAHNIFGVLALPFHLMITYSGLIFFSYLYMAPVIAVVYPDDGRQGFLAEMSSSNMRSEAAGTAAPLSPIQPLLTEAERRWGRHQIREIDIRYPGDSNARIILRRDQSGLVRRGELLVFDGVNGALLEAIEPALSVPRALRETLLGLHEGLFAGPALRWLYFLSGLMGTAMIGAGLVLWTVKRRRKSGETFGFGLVEALNLGTIVGLPIAIAAYFWANRLIPVGVPDRAAWEAHAMFVAWAAMLAHAFIRPARRGWSEQLWVAAGAFGLIPVLNALTTERHLGVTLPACVWELAGFDLTMLAFSVSFGAVAWTLARRNRAVKPVPVPAE
jgi:uncharacterized iron-regulated membrane protein